MGAGSGVQAQASTASALRPVDDGAQAERHQRPAVEKLLRVTADGLHEEATAQMQRLADQREAPRS